MPILGEFAKATLKAAVVQAENRNRLVEEDSCWRERQKEKGPNYQKNQLKLEKEALENKRKRKYVLPAKEIGPDLPPSRYRFFKAPPKNINEEKFDSPKKTKTRSGSQSPVKAK